LGIYPDGSIGQKAHEINQLDTYLGGSKITLAGGFLDFESPDSWITSELDAAWSNGYVPIINIGAGQRANAPICPNDPNGDGNTNDEIQCTAEKIANGDLDPAIRNWAQLYKAWSDNGNKRAFLAPLQEMNGEWIDYFGDPANYKKAFVRIQQIFYDEGVDPSSVSWVFAPNGWSMEPKDNFENYYPGHSVVDVVGFSSFNWGDCWTYTDPEWYEDIYEPYLDRMAVVAPGKPIFIVEIASVTRDFDRGEWFQDTLSKIGDYPGVRGVIYFNRTEDPYYSEELICDPLDYSLDADGGEGKSEFKDVVTASPYGYWAQDSTEMIDIAFGRPDATFEDAWPASDFSGKSDTYPFKSWIERLVNAGITSGCSSTTYHFSGVSDYTYRYYCPYDDVTRAQMAVFLERGIHGSDYQPPDVTPTFEDTVGNFAEDWIEALYSDGITGGCSVDPPKYCPNENTTRAQMAVFLLRSKYGSDYDPPSPTGIFNDVPVDYWAAKWIEKLYEDGITSGCGGDDYCPEDPVTRGMMSVFLVRTFDLP
jgi:hypothetical protein